MTIQISRIKLNNYDNLLHYYIDSWFYSLTFRGTNCNLMSLLPNILIFVFY